jgi:hypothetical protein
MKLQIGHRNMLSTIRTKTNLFHIFDHLLDQILRNAEPDGMAACQKYPVAVAGDADGTCLDCFEEINRSVLAWFV